MKLAKANSQANCGIYCADASKDAKKELNAEISAAANINTNEEETKLNACYSKYDAKITRTMEAASIEESKCGKEWNSWATVANQKFLLDCKLKYAGRTFSIFDI